MAAKIFDFVISTIIFTALFLGLAHQWAREDGRQHPQSESAVTVSQSVEKAAAYVPTAEIPGEVQGFRYIPPEKDYAYTAEELAVWIPVGTFKVTAYCPCEQCCGVWAYHRPDGIVYTASGEIAKEGVSVGTDWGVLPAGSRILIDGVGEYVVHDNGLPKGNVVDVYHATHEAALSFDGAGERKVYLWQAGGE